MGYLFWLEWDWEVGVSIDLRKLKECDDFIVKRSKGFKEEGELIVLNVVENFNKMRIEKLLLVLL